MKSYSVIIDEDVPLAEKRSAAGSRYLHPFSWLLPKLKIGDSFIYPASTGEKINALRAIATGYSKKYRIKLATRTVIDHEGVDRLRIWRTA